METVEYQGAEAQEFVRGMQMAAMSANAKKAGKKSIGKLYASLALGSGEEEEEEDSTQEPQTQGRPDLQTRRTPYLMSAIALTFVINLPSVRLQTQENLPRKSALAPGSSPYNNNAPSHW